MAETSQDFPVHRFVQDLFEDLTLTLPSLGCKFEGFVTPSSLTVHGKQGFLKNKLFLFFADLASLSSQLEVRFRLALQGPDLQLGFFCRPFSAQACQDFPIWDSTLFELFASSEGEGFRTTLPAGVPLEAGPPVHWRRLGQMYGGLANGRHVLDGFLARCQTLVLDLQKAIETHDCAAVLRIAHTLKGSGRGVTAEALAESALQLEMVGRSGDLTSAPDLYKALLVTYDELIQWVQEGQK